MSAPRLMRRFLLQLLFKWAQKYVENVEIKPFGLANDRPEIILHKRGKNDGVNAVFFRSCIDTSESIVRLVITVYKWQSYLSKLLAIELGQQRVAQRLSSNTGLV